MGDVGALALGAALGTVAVIVRQEIVLFIMGGVFVAETLSVMLQVLYFKCERRQAHFPHGAAAPPLRTDGLEGDPSRRAFLDHHHDAGAVRPVDLEAAMSGISREKTLWCWVWAKPVCRWRAGSSAAARACASPTRATSRRASRRSARKAAAGGTGPRRLSRRLVCRRRPHRHQSGRAAGDAAGARRRRARHPGAGRHRTVCAGAARAQRSRANPRRR